MLRFYKLLYCSKDTGKTERSKFGQMNNLKIKNCLNFCSFTVRIIFEIDRKSANFISKNPRNA